jgi:tetratricopeptide (TPR) repeat protein
VWDYDVWFQLACGKAIVVLHHLPAHDLFSFTAADHAWDTQEWLAQILFYGTWRLGGLTALTIAKALAAGLLCVALFRDATRDADAGARWIAVGCIAWGAYVMRWHFVERPQMFSMVFLAAELALLRRGTSRWPLLPVTFLWANLHGGSALLGPGMLGLWIVVERLRRTPGRPAADWLVLALSTAVILVNPSGWHLLTYPFITMHDPMYMANILEWMPPTYAEQPEFFWFLGAAVAVTAAGSARRTMPDFAAGIVTVGLALTSRRHIPLAVIALLPPAIRAAATLVPGRGAPYVRLAGPAAAIAALALAGMRGESLRLGVRHDLYPAPAVPALAALAEAIPGSAPIRVFTLHRWGGYLIWHLPPRFRQYIDGRQLVYGRELFADYCRIVSDVDATGALLRQAAPDVVVVDHDSGVTARLAASGEHALVHWDDTCRVYVRRAAVAPQWLAAHAYRFALPDPAGGAPREAVVAELGRAAREAPADGRPWTLLAEFLAANGRVEPAWSAAQEAVARKPAAVPALLTACRMAALRHDAAAADAFARRAERSDPGAAAAQVAFARLALDRGDAVDADRRIAAAIRLGTAAEQRTHRPDPAVGDGWMMRAGQAAQAGRAKDAAGAWREAGNARYRASQFAEALRCYRAGLAADPADVRLLHNVAAALTGLHRTAEARAAWRRALAANPLDPDARTILGQDQ